MSQASYGESAIQIESTHVGLVRVQDVYSGSTVAPRLCFRLGVEIKRSPTVHGGGAPEPIPFQIVDWRGELGLSEGGDAIATVSYVGDVRPIRFPEDKHEAQIRLACDLDGRRIEAIERRRAGAAPVLFLELWPQVVSATPFTYTRIAPIRVSPSRELWLRFLDACRGTHHEIIEVPIATGQREHISRAAEHLRSARRKLLDGYNTDAVGACRLAIEATSKDLSPAEPERFWTEHFSRFSGESKGRALGHLASKLKAVVNKAHHDSHSRIEFTRAEAIFLVRTTESFVALVAELASDHRDGAD